MNTITRIFNFEMAHAISGYAGPCCNIHGHSYELHVTITAAEGLHKPSADGFIMDFRDLKKIVNENIIKVYDHSLVLSEAYLAVYPCLESQPNLIRYNVEPSAENLISDFASKLTPILPQDLYLLHLRLYETKNSYAEWHLATLNII